MELEFWLQQHAGRFSSVVPFGESDRIIALDFTERNTQLNEALINDTARFATYINETLQAARAVYGIGGYAEHRMIYSRSTVFDAGSEPRRLHLGTDIWGAAGTPVFAPLAGSIHSFAFNNAFGDYGTTIILQHEREDLFFHTLYGHLNKAALKPLSEGQVVAQGQCLAYFGAPHENGHWPPHLHFQIINNMQGCKGDYPGVCRFSERAAFLANCPDPDSILNLNRFIR